LEGEHGQRHENDARQPPRQKHCSKISSEIQVLRGSLMMINSKRTCVSVAGGGVYGAHEGDGVRLKHGEKDCSAE
jgi:hypothetical protein